MYHKLTLSTGNYFADLQYKSETNMLKIQIGIVLFHYHSYLY